MVVWTFDSDVLHLSCLVRVRGAAGTELVFEQRFDLLQTPAFGLRQAAVDEEETQQSHAGVEEERSWEDNDKITHRQSQTKGTHRSASWRRVFIQPQKKKHWRWQCGAATIWRLTINMEMCELINESV